MDTGLVIVIIALGVLAALVVVLLLRGEQVMGRLRHLAESEVKVLPLSGCERI